MSAPVSATMTSAVAWPMPGMVVIRSAKERNGAIAWSIRRRANTWFVVAPQVRTVSTVLRRPAPATRIQALASFLDTSMPAHRLWITSIGFSLQQRQPRASAAGRAKKVRSLTLVLKATIHGSRGDPPHHAD